MWIIDPVSLKHFNDTYLDKDVLCVSRNEPSYFAEKLLSIEHLSKLWEQRELYWGVNGNAKDSPNMDLQINEQEIDLASLTTKLHEKQGYAVFSKERERLPLA